LGKVLLKAQFWDKINRNPVNERQRLVSNRMLEDGFKGQMKTSKYTKLVKYTTDTGLRDIQELKQMVSSSKISVVDEEPATV